MKVPPKRKGNFQAGLGTLRNLAGLNESPSEKEGKSCHPRPNIPKPKCLNESPSEKEGKYTPKKIQTCTRHPASMKVPPKRKGNLNECPEAFAKSHRLNESPSEKEGKSRAIKVKLPSSRASMKAPPKRKGNSRWSFTPLYHSGFLPQ